MKHVIFAALAALGPINAASPTDRADTGQEQPMEEKMREEDLTDDTLLKLNANLGLGDPKLASFEGLRAAAGYRGREERPDHAGGIGFITDSWNSGSSAQAQGATNMITQSGATSLSLHDGPR